MEKICKNCKHWERTNHISSYGSCNEIPYDFDKISIYTVDGLDSVKTEEDFGCTLFVSGKQYYS